jgi:dienelactone hydrolase
MLRQLVALAVILVLAGVGRADIKTKTIAYKHGDTEYKGFLAWDDAVQGARPGVLVVHEWWGLNDYARDRAKQLAGLGYVAFAADMYGEGKSVDHPKEAGEMAGKVRENVEEWRQRALAALDVLKSQPQCDKTNLAAIGYCFGGSTALELAYSGADLKAVVVFHSALPAPTAEDVKRIKPFIVVLQGAEDQFISPKSVADFKGALDDANVKYDYYAYPATGHSFTVPDADKHNIRGLKYSKVADENSWQRMKQVLADKFGK